jgi:hypothetical protein
MRSPRGHLTPWNDLRARVLRLLTLLVGIVRGSGNGQVKPTVSDADTAQARAALAAIRRQREIRKRAEEISVAVEGFDAPSRP